MQRRTLGAQGLEVSAVGYGSMGLTMAYGPTDEQAGVAAIQRAHDLGVTFFDTAELYGGGTGSNEILLGEALKDGWRSPSSYSRRTGHQGHPGRSALMALCD